MTAIAGFVKGKTVWMGCDSAITAGDIRCRTTEPKIWRSGDWLIGAAGDGRCIQLVKTYWSPATTLNPFAYLVTEGILELQSIFKAHRAPQNEMELLLASKGRLIAIDPWWHVTERPDKMDAIGSGGQAALASMMTAPKTAPPNQKIKKALEISASLVNSVEGPFILEKI